MDKAMREKQIPSSQDETNKAGKRRMVKGGN
jgi:hypothetical protein